MKYPPVIASIAVTLSLSACAQKTAENETRAPLTQHQRDSTLAKSKIPGSGAVGKALEVSDSAAARAARENEEE